MAKEIYSYNNKELSKEKLDSFAKWIFHNHCIKLYFCEIKGSRWSFYAGLHNVIASQKRIMITKKIGMVAEADSVDKKTIDKVINIIKDEVSKIKEVSDVQI